MKLFKDLSEDVESAQDFKKKELYHDEKLKKYFDKCTHKEFISAIMHLGTLFDTITVYLSFIQPQIDDTIKNLEGNNRNRKMNKYIKDLNTRINSEYDFDEDTFVVEEAVLFDGELYLFINKCRFLKMFELNKL